MKKVYNIIPSVLAWSRSLGLDKNSTVLEQTIKLYEEFGELAKAYQKNDKLELMDGIGDTLVVCTVIVSILETESGVRFEPNEEQEKCIASDSSWFSLLFELNGFTEYSAMLQPMCKNLRTINSIYEKFHRIVKALDIFCKAQLLDLYDCYNMAYQTISFRSGEIVNGIFVKKEPTHLIYVPIKLLGMEHELLNKEIRSFATKSGIKHFKVRFTNDEIMVAEKR